MVSSVSTDNAKTCDPILEELQEELIEAVEQGPEAVEQTLAAWSYRYPDREDAFRRVTPTPARLSIRAARATAAA